jgi:general stress protein 26
MSQEKDLTIDWNSLLRGVLQSTAYLALGTEGKDGPWVAPVLYAYNERLEIYFVSQLGSRHMRDVIDNPEVAIAIYDTDQPAAGDKLGIQLSGTTEIVPDEAVKEAFEIYFHGVDPQMDSSPDNFLGDSSWRMVKVVPGEVFLVHTGKFGEERQRVPGEELRGL